MSVEEQTISKEKHEEIKAKLHEVIKGLDVQSAYTVLGDLQAEIWRKALKTTIVV